MKSPEKVKDHIVNWLKKYLKNSKQNGFIVGISGGIDSALTSTLCALTNYPVFVVEMPIHQSESEVSRSKAHMKWLKKKYKNVKSITHSLTNVFESFKNGDRMTPNTSFNTIMAGLNCGIPSKNAWEIIKIGCDAVIKISDEEVKKAMRQLYNPIGNDIKIISGESGAAGLAGLLNVISDSTFANNQEDLRLFIDLALSNSLKGSPSSIMS